MKWWDRRRRTGRAEAAPLTPAQVEEMRGHQEVSGLRIVHLFLLVCFVGALSHLALLVSFGVSEYRTMVIASIVDAGLFVVAYLLVRGGRELHGNILALIVASVHMVGMYTQFSSAVGVELILLAVVLAPFLMIRHELPALRIGLSSFAAGAYLICVYSTPDGSSASSLGDAGDYFSFGNHLIIAVSLPAMMAIIQRNMSATRHILEGAARYGELRATTDELTGVFNRRPVIAQLSEWANRDRGNYAIALIDLDHFKSINDEYGHDCGDLILQAVATTMRNHFRDSDMVSRWGGDEFLVLIPGVRHADLVPILERLRRSIHLIEKECNDHAHTITVSIGASMGAIGQTPDECIAAADHALYRAKEEGRNKVVAVGVGAPARSFERHSPEGLEQ